MSSTTSKRFIAQIGFARVFTALSLVPIGAVAIGAVGIGAAGTHTPPGRRSAMNAQFPVSRRIAALAELRCISTFVHLLVRKRIHMPSEHLNMRLRFADGTAGRVYRETTIDRELRRIHARSWSRSSDAVCAGSAMRCSARRAC